MHKNTNSIKGLTVKSICKQATNCWRMDFTNGDFKYLWAEPDGPMGISQLWLSEREPIKISKSKARRAKKLLPL